MTSNPKSFHLGDYLTDQRRLYRLLQFVPARLGRRAAILEDCGTLETILIRPGQLRRMRLQRVRRPADGLAGSPTARDDASPVPVFD